MAQFRFSTVPCVECGFGVVAGAAAHCNKLGVDKLLIVTDPGLLQLGLVDSLTGPLQQAGIAVLAQANAAPQNVLALLQ